MVAGLLKREEEGRIQGLMEEGYREMAEENRRLAEERFQLATEAILRSPEWDERVDG